MTYFIKFIIKRTELINSEKKSISLDSEKQNNLSLKHQLSELLGIKNLTEKN